MQVVGLTSASQFKGSLIRYINLAESGQRFLPLLGINSCKFEDNSFIGSNSALISIRNGILHVEDSRFRNNGYLSLETFQARK